MKHPSLTVILPTYNEAENIIPLIRKIQKYIPAFSTILVVDDDSPDGTAQRVQQFKKTHKTNTRVHLLVRTANRGLTNSLKAAIAVTKGSIVLWMDCDFSHPPAVIPQLIAAITGGADIAVASRFLKTTKVASTKQPTGDFMAQTPLSRRFNSLISRLFGSTITDYTTGFLAARRAILDHIPLRGNYGEYCIDLLVRAQAAGYRIEEIPYRSPPRLLGQSKTAPNLATLMGHGYGYIDTLFRLLRTIKFQHRDTV